MTLLLMLLLGVPVLSAPPAQASPAGAPEFLLEAAAMMREGRYRQAEERLQSAPASDPFVLRLLLELAERRGDRDGVELQGRELLRLHESGQLQGSGQIAQAAFAAWKLGRWQDSNQLFLEAARARPAYLSLYVDWGRLYLSKFNPAEAESIFQEGIQAGEPPGGYSRWRVPDAYAGLARAQEQQFKPAAEQTLGRALELDPQNLEALTFQALLRIEGREPEEARRALREGLEVNPEYLPLLEAACALAYEFGDPGAFEEARRAVLAVNPRDGALFELLGDLAGRSRRVEEAIEFYREALRRDPRLESARASLGISLLRMGEEEEGQAVLETAYANDPFNIWTVNTLRLLDSFDNFVRFETPHFRVKLHRKEAGALKPYVEALLEESLAALSQKYNHSVSGPYTFEMYPDHDDFAVRTMGLPGLGALGATFGRIVAMDSPSARKKGEFHWGSTLWHEVAHVVTLSLSKQKVPRWFTEGISMMEERLAGEGWGDYLSPGFVSAYQAGALLPLARLNAGFERPGSPQQLTLSYFQAGWLCDFLAERYGFPALRAMLVAFGEGLKTEEVFETVLEASVEEIDQRFHEEMEGVLRPLVDRLEKPGGAAPVLELPGQDAEAAAEPSAQNLESLQLMTASRPENYFLNLQTGALLKAAGRGEEAVPYLEKALDLFPTHAGADSPYPLLAEIYETTGQAERELEVRRSWWKAAPLFVENALRLTGLLRERDRLEEARRCLEEVMYVDPLEPRAHESLGEVYLESGVPELAVREFESLLALNPVDPAASHYKLAQSLLRSGQKARARTHVLLSLEIAPNYREAQRLLLEMVEP